MKQHDKGAVTGATTIREDEINAKDTGRRTFLRNFGLLATVGLAPQLAGCGKSSDPVDADTGDPIRSDNDPTDPIRADADGGDPFDSD